MSFIRSAITLGDLPSPPSDKIGWPWTKGTKPLSERMPDGSECPRISIVTPNYNYGHFLEETIRSVLLQGYPNLEYIIIDGGSTDNSIETIKKYEPWLKYWVSEPDKGQSDAINKGFRKATGEIIAFLNSDDLYCLNTLSHVVKWYISSHTNQWLVGNSQFTNDKGESIRLISPKLPNNLFGWLQRPFVIGKKICPECPQPSVFLKKKHIETIGYFDESFNFCFDHEYWVRLILKGYLPNANYQTLSQFRIHDESKTGSNDINFLREDILIIQKYISILPFIDKLKMKYLLNRHYCQQQIAQVFQEVETLTYSRKILNLLKYSLIKPILLTHRAWLGLIRRQVLSPLSRAK